MNPQAAHFDRLIIRAGAVADGIGVYAAPGVLILDGVRVRNPLMVGERPFTAEWKRQPGHVDNLTLGQCTVLAAGSPQAVGNPPPGTAAIDLPDAVIIPALVNAHAHLDLTHIGPQPAPEAGGFPAWAEMIRRGRAATEQTIAESVRLGIDLAIRGGTAAIGDIAGGRSSSPIQTLRRSGLNGISFVEVFGLGQSQSRSAAVLKAFLDDVPENESGVRLGVQPHSPYSCGLDLYQAAADSGLPMSTHLAETLEEVEFTRSATGPLADMLKRLGVWDDTITGDARHPIDHLEPILHNHRCLAAHVNYLDDGHLRAMSRWPISVAYCPRASAYFGHPMAGHRSHRYREMIDAGINVALGTDSIVCLPPEHADRLSVLDEMQFLHQRDGTDPALLIRMATINGARALSLPENSFTLNPGPTAGVISVMFNHDDGRSPLASMLQSSG